MGCKLGVGWFGRGGLRRFVLVIIVGRGREGEVVREI